MEEWSRGWPARDEIPIGILLSQLTLAALWLGLGDGRWYVRLVVAIPLTFCLAKTIGIANQLSPKALSRGQPDPSAMIFFILLAMLLASSCFAFVLRRTRSWRLTWQQIGNVHATRQFQIGDALLWMIVVSGSLAALRFLVSIDNDFPAQLLDISMYTVKTMMVVTGTMIVAFSTRRKIRGLVLITLVVLVIGALFAVPDAYENVQRMRGGTPPTPFYRYVAAWANQTKKHEAFVIAAALGGLVNCLVLRALGCRLVRPSVAGDLPQSA